MTHSNKRVSVYQPEQEGLIYPEVPEFTSVKEERQYRKERLVAACRAFAAFELDYGFAGHLTVRDPEFPELYWTNPMAVHFSRVRVSTLILVDHEGKVVEGNYAVNQAVLLHAAVHEVHPDIIAMCHAHTVYGTAWATLGRPLDPISQDAAAFFEDHAVITDQSGRATVEKGTGGGIAEALGKNRAAIHQNHGLLTVSRHSIDSAAFWFIALERCCKQQLLVEATDKKPVWVPEEKARYSRKHIGSEYAGWLHFQPVYEKLVYENPDMFD